jgi:DNA-binding SARP family transcriptional activator
VKDLGLLAYLTLVPGPHRREELASLLWGDSLEPQARASLRQSLRRLRLALGPGGGLETSRETIELTAPVECDVRSFEALAQSDPAQAVTLNIPTFMTGFAVPHAPDFEEWIGDTRRRLLRTYHELLANLARDGMKHWRWREAAAYADRLLESDPLSDEACRLAVEGWFLAGDRGEALARFARHAEAMSRELNTMPSAALVELRSRIEAESEPSPRPISDEWFVRTPKLEGPLIGREDQWAALMAVWKSLSRGTEQVVLIEGEAGVGKSRLVEEFLRWATAEGATILRGQGYDPKSGIPYGPVVEALSGAIGAPGLAGTDPQWLTEVTRVLPDLQRSFPLLPEPSPPTDATERWRLFEAIAQVGLALAAERTLVVFIDDMQWCDSETCALLHFLARRWTGAPIALVTTCTLGEMERGAPSARLYRALRVLPHATIVGLAALSEEQVLDLIRQLGRLAAPTAGKRLAQRISEVTNGNPFYVSEVLKTLFVQEILAVDGDTGEWTLGPQATADITQRFPLPRSLRDAIGARTERLSSRLQNLLTTVGVAGGGCSSELLSHVNGISRLHAAALGDELVERHLLVEDAGFYRCAHPLIADVVRTELSATRRSEIDRAIALALDRLTPAAVRLEQAGRIARHAERGGERQLAFRYAILASKAAVRRYAFEEGLSWLDLAAGVSDTPAEVEEANRLTAELLDAAGWTQAPAIPGIKDSLFRELRTSDLDFAGD